MVEDHPAMRLFYTASSPFVRKCLIAARELGLENRIETTFLRPAPTRAVPELSAVNPLAKIPALVLDDGMVLYDSPVICEYLDTLHQGRKLVPPSGPERWWTLRVQALCDGIIEAGIAVRFEFVERPEEFRWDGWVRGQTEKAVQGLDALERECTKFGEAVDLAQIAAAAAIGWLEFRNPIGEIRAGRPKLTAFFERFSKRPSMLATMPSA
jgi:glutathione S-transferase